MKKLLAAFALTCTYAHGATSFGTDMSDLWWNIQKNGEGFNVIQQGDILFITYFVYQSGAPVWYVSSSANYVGRRADGALTFSGAVYATAGSPPAVTVQQVGTMSFTATTVHDAVLEYTVNGVSYTKDLTRQTWRNNTLAGSYIGASIGTSSCTGYAEDPATITITENGALVSILASYAGSTCTYAGAYIQDGRMGRIVNGTASCTNGNTGTFAADELEVSPQGITGRASAFVGACSWTGRIGGLRRGP
jgi:hypothetical protein